MAASGASLRGYAQETVVIGGSGLPSVEIHLEALDQVAVAPITQRRLLMPGERRPVLRSPASDDASATRTAARDTAATETPRLEPETPARAETAAATAAEPEPMPAQEMAVAPPAAEEVPDPAPTATASAAPVAEPEPAPVVEPSPEPKPARVVEPEPEPEARQVASLPRVTLPPGGGQVLRIEFSGNGTRLSPEAEESLRAVAAAATEADGRLQLQAFAGGSSENASGARRTSLSRALAVRSFLIEAGVRSTRVDVRALGTAGDSGPAERVDVLYVAR